MTSEPAERADVLAGGEPGPGLRRQLVAGVISRRNGRPARIVLRAAALEVVIIVADRVRLAAPTDEDEQSQSKELEVRHHGEISSVRIAICSPRRAGLSSCSAFTAGRASRLSRLQVSGQLACRV